LHAVAVEVIPYEVAQFGRTIVASIPGAIVFARNQVGVDRHARHQVCVAVHGIIAALIFRSGVVICWFRERYFISARFEVGEQVETCCVGGHVLHDDVAVAGRAIELHGYAGDTGFASILKAVAVGVVPHEVANLGRLIQTCVHGQVGLARHKRVVAAHVGGLADVAVGRVVSAEVGGADRVATWDGYGDFIGTGHEVREVVNAAGVGGR